MVGPALNEITIILQLEERGNHHLLHLYILLLTFYEEPIMAHTLSTHLINALLKSNETLPKSTPQCTVKIVQSHPTNIPPANLLTLESSSSSDNFFGWSLVSSDNFFLQEVLGLESSFAWASVQLQCEGNIHFDTFLGTLMTDWPASDLLPLCFKFFGTFLGPLW